MYSDEDRIRAVKLYIKLGKRTRPTIRQLGYPTKNALKSWHREYEHSRDLQVRYARSRQKYSTEQMQAAVAHYFDHDRCIASTMKALGYPCRGTLTAWIDELHPEMRNRVVGRAANVQHTGFGLDISYSFCKNNKVSVKWGQLHLSRQNFCTLAMV